MESELINIKMSTGLNRDSVPAVDELQTRVQSGENNQVTKKEEQTGKQLLTV